MVRSRSDRPPGSPGAWLQTVSRGKVTRSWRVLFSEEGILVRVNRRSVDNSYLLSDGDFVLCQGESGSGASLGACNRLGSMGVVVFRQPATENRRLIPLLRLMSDRESASGVSKPRFGFSRIGRNTPKSDSEGSEALCVMIRMRSVLLKEWIRVRVLCRR